MTAKTLILTAAGQSLLSLLGSQAALRGKVQVILQAPSGNATPVFYGTKAAQVMELAPGETQSHLAPLSAKDLHLRGAGLIVNVLTI